MATRLHRRPIKRNGEGTTTLRIKHTLDGNGNLLHVISINGRERASCDSLSALGNILAVMVPHTYQTNKPKSVKAEE